MQKRAQLIATPMLRIIHFSLAVSIVALGYSAMTYFWLSRVEIPVIEQLYPQGANRIADIISLQLPDTKRGNSAKALAHNQAFGAHVAHKTWLDLTRTHANYARNELIIWVFLTALLLALTFVVHRDRRRSNNSFKPKPLRGSA
jgi:hypothetical protein